MHYLCWDLWTLKHAMREIIEGKGGEKQKSLRILIFNFCFENLTVLKHPTVLSRQKLLQTLYHLHIF